MQLEHVSLSALRSARDLGHHLPRNRESKTAACVRGIWITRDRIGFRSRSLFSMNRDTHITVLIEALSLQVRRDQAPRFRSYSLEIHPSEYTNTALRKILNIRDDRLGINNISIAQPYDRIRNWIQELINSRYPLPINSTIINGADSSSTLLRVQQYPIKRVLIIPHKRENHQATLERPFIKCVITFSFIEFPHPFDKYVPEFRARTRHLAIVIKKVLA